MIASSAFHQLKSRFRGELIVPGDQQYDAARKVFNVTIDRKPALEKFIRRHEGPEGRVGAASVSHGTCQSRA